MSQLHQELIQLLLTISKLSASTIVDPEAIHDAINDQQPVFPTSELFTESIQQLQLVFAIKCSRISNVLLSSISIDTKPLRNLSDALRPESSLGINICHLAACAAQFLRKLGYNRHGVR